MIRKTILITMVAGLAAGTATAQDKRVEISAGAGWTFSDGVSGSGIRVPGIGTFDTIEPKDSASWNARIGFMVNENSEIGVLSTSSRPSSISAARRR